MKENVRSIIDNKIFTNINLSQRFNQIFLMIFLIIFFWT